MEWTNIIGILIEEFIADFLGDLGPVEKEVSTSDDKSLEEME